MLTRDEVTMVQEDWRLVVPIGPTAATLFYDRLFELDPKLRSLFRPDLSEQKNKLLQMLAAAIRGLDDLAALVPVVQALGVRHKGYGVKSEHYATVGSALLWTLKQGLGETFDAAHEGAWAKVYGVLAETMQTASAAAE